MQIISCSLDNRQADLVITTAVVFQLAALQIKYNITALVCGKTTEKTPRFESILFLTYYYIRIAIFCDRRGNSKGDGMTKLERHYS